MTRLNQFTVLKELQFQSSLRIFFSFLRTRNRGCDPSHIVRAAAHRSKGDQNARMKPNIFLIWFFVYKSYQIIDTFHGWKRVFISVNSLIIFISEKVWSFRAEMCKINSQINTFLRQHNIINKQKVYGSIVLLIILSYLMLWPKIL